MKEIRLAGFDHLVLTTGNLAACLDFYVGVLGMRHEFAGGRHTLYFGRQKFNVHTRPGEFLPAAEKAAARCLDFCLVVEGADIEEVSEYLEMRGQEIELGPVRRRGAQGEMWSVYLRDPDGNLVELAVYEK